MQAFVPKIRKPKFDLTLRIIDLTNIPLIAGTATVRWHLSSSTTTDHRGRTPSSTISEHKATWEYVKTLPVRLTIDKNGNLQECDLQFEVLQEFHDSGSRGGRVHLGNAKLNLAEYTRLPDGSLDPADEADEEGEGSITRRYLLQDSKINSTLKIGIQMRQTEGDMNFIAPPLKSAMVVGGIASVLTTEAGALSGGNGTPGSGEANDLPSITSKTRELSEAQDIYRRTLAATWACQAGEMAPDKLIEDLFAGGDGGRPSGGHHKKHLPHPNPARLGGGRDTSMNSSSSSDEHARYKRSTSLTSQPYHDNHGHRHTSGHSTPRPQVSTHPSSLLTPQMATNPAHHPPNHRRISSRDSPSLTPMPSFNLQTPTPTSTTAPVSFHGHSNGNMNGNGNGTAVSGRGSIEQQIQQSQSVSEHRRRERKDFPEYTEFDLRDDLRSWSVRVK